MKNFFSCISKDLKLFGRSRVSALVTVVVPLLIVLLVGTAFSSTTLQGVNVGVYSSSYGDLTESIISSFEEQSFFVNRLDSIDSCVKSVQTGEVQICVVFPPDLSDEGNEESIVFHVDNSRMNIAYVLINDIQSRISVKSSEVGEDLVGDLIVALKGAKESLPEQKSKINLAASEVSQIGIDADDVTPLVPNVDAVLSKLNDAKNLTGEMNVSFPNVPELKTKIDAAISEVGLLDAELSEVPGEVESLAIDSSGVESKLAAVNSGIDEVIFALNKVRVTEAGKIVSPIKTVIEPINIDKTNSSFIFPTLLALMVLFTSILLASVLALKEKKTRAFFRNFITPTSDFTFLMSMYVTSLLILAVQLCVLFSGLILIARMALFDILGNIAFVLFISATTFIFLGMFIGHLFKSEETAILVTISVASLMMVFSNIILPIETIAGKFSYLATYNPLVVSASILKKMILFGASIGSVLSEFYILFIAIPVFFLLAFVARKITKRFV